MFAVNLRSEGWSVTSGSEGLQMSSPSPLLQPRCLHRRWPHRLRTLFMYKQTDFNVKVLKTAVLFMYYLVQLGQKTNTFYIWNQVEKYIRKCN